jgi:hypothetical protein
MVAHRALGLTATAAGDLATARRNFASGRAAAATVGAASFERELAGFEASVVHQLDRGDEAHRLIGWVIDRSVEADDHLTEAWARLVRSTMAMRAGEWEAAADECRRARVAIERLDYGWWEGAIARVEAAITAHHAGWAGSVEVWERAVSAAVSNGSEGELALTLRDAASVAARLGHDDVAVALLRAAPASTEIGVLPDPFPEDLRRAERLAGPTAPPRDIAVAFRRARAALAPGRAATTPPTPTTGATLRREGDAWSVDYAGRHATVRHLKGMADLAVLLASPGTEVHCLQLMGGADVGGAAGPVLDDRARRAYQQRIRDLQGDIDDAHERGDGERAARAEVELDALVTQLSEAFGLGGRDRAKGSATERARAAVTYRIRAALRRVGDAHPELGRHLANAVRTGTWCTYRPETDVVWEVAAAQPASR